jgi:hypothetical protein
MTDTRFSPIGLRGVTADVDPRLIAAIAEFFEEDFSDVRFLQIREGSLADRIARAYSPRARAFAWGRHVLFPAGREEIWRESWRAENARTIAHELWHILELREFGLLRWAIVFLREWRRHGLRGMQRADHEIRAREAAEAFVRSEEYRRGACRM